MGEAKNGPDRRLVLIELYDLRCFDRTLGTSPWRHFFRPITTIKKGGLI